jgi:hypothetical protein
MKVLLLCPPTLTRFQRDVLDRIRANPRHEVVGCLIDSRPAAPLRDKLLRNLRRGRGGYVLIMGLRLLRNRHAPPQASTRTFLPEVPCVDYAPGDDLPIVLQDWRPDVVLLVGGYGIIRGALLTVAPLGVISYHHGDLRRYRGQPPGFWEIYNGERVVGVTVQRLGRELDAGEPIVEKEFAIIPGETVGHLTRRMFAESAAMMSDALDVLSVPDRVPVSIESYGRLYTLPNLRQWLMCELKPIYRRFANTRRRAPG